MSARKPAGAEVRAAAARLVAQVVDDRIAIEAALRAAPPLGRDQALLAALVFGALRWHHRLEWQATRLLTRPLKPQQTELAALLRVGLLQLQELRVPAHAAVSATVDAAALLGQRNAGGLVNAVLRRFLRERERLARDADRELIARFSHPSWLIEALRRDWPEVWQRILDANNDLPPMWLRVNRLRTTRSAYLSKLEAAGIAATAALDSDSAVRLAAPQATDTLPGFADGEVSVQDVAAQRAAVLLELQPGQRVLDACAAPGGKTAHILESCPGLAEVWALDRDPLRLEPMADNLRRLGLAARLVLADATRPAEWWDARLFDRILLDAPCSALGVIRRHPEIKVLRRPADIDRVVGLQAELLAALWPLLAPGGRLVYATCTVLKRENDSQMAAFQGSNGAPGPAAGCRISALQTLPGEAQGDGFYYASVLKPPALRNPSVSPAQP